MASEMKRAEWTYVQNGTVQTKLMDQQGDNEVMSQNPWKENLYLLISFKKT